jgi:hypothetical protein
LNNKRSRNPQYPVFHRKGVKNAKDLLDKILHLDLRTLRLCGKAFSSASLSNRSVSDSRNME